MAHQERCTLLCYQQTLRNAHQLTKWNKLLGKHKACRHRDGIKWGPSESDVDAASLCPPCMLKAFERLHQHRYNLLPVPPEQWSRWNPKVASNAKSLQLHFYIEVQDQGQISLDTWSMISWKVLIHATHSASSIRSSWLYLDKPEWHRCKKPTQPQCGQGGQSFIFRNCVSLGMIRIRLLCSGPSLARISVDEWISHWSLWPCKDVRSVISLAFVCSCWNPATTLQLMFWYSFS